MAHNSNSSHHNTITRNNNLYSRYIMFTLKKKRPTAWVQQALYSLYLL